jgi:hypothetical protein
MLYAAGARPSDYFAELRVGENVLEAKRREEKRRERKENNLPIL